MRGKERRRRAWLVRGVRGLGLVAVLAASSRAVADAPPSLTDSCPASQIRATVQHAGGPERHVRPRRVQADGRPTDGPVRRRLHHGRVQPLRDMRGDGTFPAVHGHHRLRARLLLLQLWRDASCRVGATGKPDSIRGMGLDGLMPGGRRGPGGHVELGSLRRRQHGPRGGGDGVEFGRRRELGLGGERGHGGRRRREPHPGPCGDVGRRVCAGRRNERSNQPRSRPRSEPGRLRRRRRCSCERNPPAGRRLPRDVASTQKPIVRVRRSRALSLRSSQGRLDTSTGALVEAVSPSPSWPKSLLPSHCTPPLVSSTQKWSWPRATSFTSAMPVNGVGAEIT